MQYILEGHRIVEENDLLVWGRWMGAAERHVGDDVVGDIRVSTVFLGLGHGHDKGLPILFETMVFGGDYDQEGERYCSWDEAAVGHKGWLEKVQNNH